MKKEKKQRAEKMYKKAVSIICMAVILALLSGSGGCERGGSVHLDTEEAFKDTEEKNEKEAEAADTEKDLATTIWVHVCGAVVSPGVYELAEGSRIYEAVEAAGGMREEAAGDYLNMAQILFDGSKVIVPFLSDLEEGEHYGSAEGTDTEGVQLVDINRAGKEELMTLPGVGEAKAEAVIAYREKHGAFKQPEDIMLVTGIKEAAYEKLKDKITVR